MATELESTGGVPIPEENEPEKDKEKEPEEEKEYSENALALNDCVDEWNEFIGSLAMAENELKHLQEKLLHYKGVVPSKCMLLNTITVKRCNFGHVMEALSHNAKIKGGIENLMIPVTIDDLVDLGVK